METFKEFFTYIIRKILSARFLVVLALVGTLCYTLLKSLDLMVVNANNEILFPIFKDLFLVIFGAFIGFVGTAVTFYFTRTDRHINNGEEKQI